MRQTWRGAPVVSQVGYKGASGDVETLGDCIERHRTRVENAERDAGLRRRGLSNQQLRERSNVHWSTIQDWIDTGLVGRPEQLHDLAAALTIPQDPSYRTDQILAELQAAAGLPVGAGVEWDHPADYLLLDIADRHAIDGVIVAMAQKGLKERGLRRPHGRIVREQPANGGGGARSEEAEQGDAPSSP